MHGIAISTVRRIALWVLLFPLAACAADPFRFVIIGDRTGSAQAGVYERVWQEAAAEKPAFVVSAGDTIEGLNDASAAREWADWQGLMNPYRQIPLYLTPGNHDVWSPFSESLFRRISGHAPHYSFDSGPAHFTILDNSRTEQFSAAELAFLEDDLKAHAAQPVKFIVSHRPSWALDVMMNKTDFAVHSLAKKYGVNYVMAGHIHGMLHAELDGVNYVSLPSAGGNLRASHKYEDGWFFGYTVVEVSAKGVSFGVRELHAPLGQGRATKLESWGKSGLL